MVADRATSYDNTDDLKEVVKTEVKTEKGKGSSTESILNVADIIEKAKEVDDDFGDDDDFAKKRVEDDSIYPEVRASVPATDDPTLVHNTIRAWFLGLSMSTIGAAINTLLGMHWPPLFVSANVAGLVALPLGRLWARYVPNVKIFGKYGPSLNPGPFNIKEHGIIMLLTANSFGTAYVISLLLTMHLDYFYGRQFGWLFDLLAIWTTECIGFCFSGICNKVLVNPPAMVWPGVLPDCTFLTNLHVKQAPTSGVHTWRITRLKFFIYVSIGSFAWYWIPGYLCQALSYVSFVTWAFPNNVLINQIFGVFSGMGLIPITFDWNQLTALGSPLIPPVRFIITLLCSVVLVHWIFVPLLHFNNVWFGDYLPLVSSATYDKYQKRYDVRRIVDAKSSLDEKAYLEYSKMYLPVSFAVSYGLAFAEIASLVSHAALFQFKFIMKQVKAARNDKGDVHNRLMRNYRQVPWWWYMVLLAIFVPLSVITVRVWDTEMPVWALFFSLGLAVVFMLPVGIMYATTNFVIGLNVISELIIGYIMPGRPFAMMFFKTFSLITNVHAISFSAGMKFGHYMKLAPRVVFSAQFIATLWSGTVQLIVMRWAIRNTPDLCQPTQKGGFVCRNVNVFYSASIVWGTLGPARLFGKGELYSPLNWGFLIGFILPFVNWLVINKWPKFLKKYEKWPKYIAKNLVWPVFFLGSVSIPPANAYNVVIYCLVGIFFGLYVKRNKFHWWAKYNYTLALAMDLGVAIAVLIMFFALTWHNIDPPNWWGNNVVTSTLDSSFRAIKVILKEGESFAP
ncbi:HDL342Cp [Eremothecium sinecaudum]|uniref:HDL342Cp n=1 Tax=Eremothecium sinecaudum TaxID=45286 RepID=A0A109UYV3_9SACH|nr:HDL342Cp [Eremothecium sinecaudum]AMD20402.1 HDL342Cp [Eremothecium sinecaudum]